jgi:BON domain
MSDQFKALVGVLGFAIVATVYFTREHSHPASPQTANANGPASRALGAHISVDYSGGGVTLLGVLPTEEAHQRLLQRAREAYGREAISDRIAVDRSLADASWSRSDQLTLPLLPQRPSDGQASFDGQTLRLTGAVQNAETKAEIDAAVARALAPGITVENHLQISPAGG